MYGGTTREDPEYPGILSIPDTVSVRGVCMGGQLGNTNVYNCAFAGYFAKKKASGYSEYRVSWVRVPPEAAHFF